MHRWWTYHKIPKSINPSFISPTAKDIHLYLRKRNSHHKSNSTRAIVNERAETQKRAIWNTYSNIEHTAKHQNQNQQWIILEKNPTENKGGGFYSFHLRREEGHGGTSGGVEKRRAGERLHQKRCGVGGASKETRSDPTRRISVFRLKCHHLLI